MTEYLAQLSAKGKERGFREFVYKKTPQGELRVYFAMPKGWSADDQRPVILFFYGGAWSSGNVFSYDEQAEYFTKLGVVAGMADYRVRSRHGTKPDICVEDGRSLVRWVRANSKMLGVRRDRVIVGGGSAGGHVAACTALTDAPNGDSEDLSVSCIPNGLMLCYPVVDFGVLGSTAEELLGKTVADQISPMRHVRKDWPPTIFFFGSADRHLSNGITMHNKLRDLGVPGELHIAEGQGHAFVNFAPWNYISSKVAADFFMHNDLIDKAPLPDVPPGSLRKYAGEPVDQVYTPMRENPTRALLGGRKAASQPVTSTRPTTGAK